VSYAADHSGELRCRSQWGVTLPITVVSYATDHSGELGCRSQWPRGLRPELSSPVRTLGSWVLIPLEAWMSLCVYSVFMLLCV
jgi:hypothetical protein